MDVRFHPEVPLVAFFGLVHLGASVSTLVFGRGRRGDAESLTHFLRAPVTLRIGSDVDFQTLDFNGTGSTQVVWGGTLRVQAVGFYVLEIGETFSLLGFDPNMPYVAGLRTPGTITVGREKFLTFTFTRPLAALDLTYQVEVGAPGKAMPLR